MQTIYFKRKINAKKPSTIINKTVSCPFCDKKQLAKIIDEKEEITFVENKYNTLVGAKMYVLIESNQCNANYHTYSITKLKKLLDYSLMLWNEIKENSDYKSVAMFKNKGKLSGGSLAHPHMQIIGFNDVDCNQHIKIENLEGIDIRVEDFAIFNLSKKPLVSFIEYNINLNQDMIQIAKTIKMLICYIEDNYKGDEASYNLFFYDVAGQAYLKIMTRYPTSPITLGFGLSQIYDEQTLLSEKEVLEEYFVNNIDCLDKNILD